MKKIVFLMITLLMICSICFAVEFTDFDLKDPNLSEGYQTAMEFLVNEKVISGYPDGSFKPTKTITRAEFSKVIVTAFGIKVDPNDVGTFFFTDIKETAWYRGYVYALAREKIFVGYEDGSFGPEKEITLGEIVLVLDRVAGYSEGKEENSKFSKLVNVFDFAQKDGLFNGYLSNDLISTKPETRDNVVILVYNAMMYKEEKANAATEPSKPEKEIKETALVASQTYFGVVGAQIEEKGEMFVEVDSFENGIIKLKVLKLEKMPTEKSLIIFTPRKTGKVALDKEFKVTDVEENYLLVDEIDEEVVAFKNDDNYLDTNEDYYMYGSNKIRLYEQDYYLVTAEEDEKEGIIFTDCVKVEKPEYKEEDRIFFDVKKDICIILRGLEAPENNNDNA